MNAKLFLRVYAGYSIIGGLSMLFFRAMTEGGDPSMATTITAEQSMGAYVIGLGGLIWFMSEIEDAALFRGLIILGTSVVLIMLYNIVVVGVGVPPMFLAVIMNGALIAVSWPKMR